MPLNKYCNKLRLNLAGYSYKSIRQVLQRKVIDFHLNQKNPIRLFFAIPEHPWGEGEAAVTIAMTAAELDDLKKPGIAQVGTVLDEGEASTPEDSATQIVIEWKAVGKIFGNLRTGANFASTCMLKSNAELSSTGVKLHGAGFILKEDEAVAMGYGERCGALVKNNDVIKKYMNGRDLAGNSRGAFVIDFNNLSKEEAANYPEPFQRVLETVKPEREVNRDKQRRENWWLFGRSNKQLRQSLESLPRYIATVETAKHRVFVFLEDVLPDNMLIAIALDDAYFLGILSSGIHVRWALASGGDLGGVTPRYNKTICFDRFPFPDATEAQKQKIRDLGERLDSHRKRVQATHPEVTITAMYNLLEKLRAGQPLDDKDKAFNQKALVSTLKQIHDELDAAVFDAYGWSTELTDDQLLENLVTLNAQRAEEERNGIIRWLRPDYQAPNTVPLQGNLEGISTATPELAVTPATQQPFPKDFKDQLAAIRDLLRTQGGEWSIDAIAQHFKNATRSKAKIQASLEALETLGILTRHTENAEPKWYFTELQTIA